LFRALFITLVEIKKSVIYEEECRLFVERNAQFCLRLN
jgi:hypothetical protein